MEVADQSYVIAEKVNNPLSIEDLKDSVIETAFPNI